MHRYLLKNATVMTLVSARGVLLENAYTQTTDNRDLCQMIMKLTVSPVAIKNAQSESTVPGKLSVGK